MILATGKTAAEVEESAGSYLNMIWTASTLATIGDSSRV
jgi:hypothetical protein